MYIRCLFGVTIAVTSVTFAAIVGIETLTHAGDHHGPCNAVAVACPAWGANDPSVPGWCCIAVAAGAVDCSADLQVKSVMKSVGSPSCGRMAPIVMGECGETTLSHCGIALGFVGCISGNCGS
jgi:hypothetical protein